MRAMGFAERVAGDFAALESDVQTAIRAYTDGINHYIRTLHVVPLEFMVLRSEPTLWKPEDVILVSKLMSVRLAGNMHRERLNAALSGTLGPGRLETLFEDWPRGGMKRFFVKSGKTRTTRVVESAAGHVGLFCTGDKCVERVGIGIRAHGVRRRAARQ